MVEAATLITTIIPTYQRAGRLAQAVESVLNQTFPHLQVCIFDNASTDETEKTVTCLSNKDSRVRYYRHLENIGAVKNFQFGLERINTPFFSFLSDDDLLMPHFYETALAGFSKYPESMFSYCNVLVVDERKNVLENEILGWKKQEYFTPPEGLYAMLQKHLNWTGMLFKREVIEKIGAIDLELKTIDLDYVLRVCAHHPFVVSRTAGALFISHKSSYSRCAGLKLIWPSWQIMMQKLDQDSLLSFEIKKKVRQIMMRRLGLFLFYIAKNYIEQKKFAEAKQTLAIFEEQLPNNKKRILMKMIFHCCYSSSFLHRLFLTTLKLKRWFPSIDLFRKKSIGPLG